MEVSKKTLLCFIRETLEKTSPIHTYTIKPILRFRCHFRDKIHVSGIPGITIFDSIEWTTRSTIHHVVARDHTENRTGGAVCNHDIGNNNVMLKFASTALGGPIELSVHVYGEPAPPAHFFLGQLSERSVLAQT